MNALLKTLLFLAVLGGTTATASAADCGDRPCGPDSLGPLRVLVPQQFAGADFRPACRRHDRCYGIPGISKQTCDRRYLNDMNGRCEGSRHPIACKLFARAMYSNVRWGGGGAYRKSQRMARRGR